MKWFNSLKTLDFKKWFDKDYWKDFEKWDNWKDWNEKDFENWDYWKEWTEKYMKEWNKKQHDLNKNKLKPHQQNKNHNVPDRFIAYL